MAETQAMIGYGSKFEIGDTEGGTPNTELAEVKNITWPSATVDMQEATHMQSPDATREFVPGLTDPGECSFAMNYIPGSASDNFLTDLLAVPPKERKRSCRITAPNGVTYTFTGLLMTYEPVGETEGIMQADVSFRVSGVVVKVIP